jgi:hypothetical protein
MRACCSLRIQNRTEERLRKAHFVSLVPISSQEVHSGWWLHEINYTNWLQNWRKPSSLLQFSTSTLTNFIEAFINHHLHISRLALFSRPTEIPRRTTVLEAQQSLRLLQQFQRPQ